MPHLVHCPNCHTTAAPARRWSVASTGWLLAVIALWAGSLVLAAPTGVGKVFAEIAGILTIVGLPLGLILGALARSRVCSACGYRHVIESDATATLTPPAPSKPTT